MSNLTYTCDISKSLQAGIGEGGLSVAGYEAALILAQAAAARLKAQHEAGALVFTQLPTETADIATLKPFAAALMQDTADLVILGIGGSSLGAQVLAELTGWGLPGSQSPKGRPNIHLPENLDPLTFERLLKSGDLKTTRFLVISRSEEHTSVFQSRAEFVCRLLVY